MRSIADFFKQFYIKVALKKHPNGEIKEYYVRNGEELFDVLITHFVGKYHFELPSNHDPYDVIIENRGRYSKVMRRICNVYGLPTYDDVRIVVYSKSEIAGKLSEKLEKTLKVIDRIIDKLDKEDKILCGCYSLHQEFIDIIKGYRDKETITFLKQKLGKIDRNSWKEIFEYGEYVKVYINKFYHVLNKAIEDTLGEYFLFNPIPLKAIERVQNLIDLVFYLGDKIKINFIELIGSLGKFTSHSAILSIRRRNVEAVYHAETIESVIKLVNENVNNPEIISKITKELKSITETELYKEYREELTRLFLKTEDYNLNKVEKIIIDFPKQNLKTISIQTYSKINIDIEIFGGFIVLNIIDEILKNENNQNKKRILKRILNTIPIFRSHIEEYVYPLDEYYPL